MPFSRRIGRVRPLALALSGVVAAALALGTSGVAGAERPAPLLSTAVHAGAFQAGTYIVQLAGDPVTTYTGGVAGIPRTAPRPGQKIDPQSSAARAYRHHLDQQRARVLDSVPGAQRIYAYDTAFNGFAAHLTDAAATELSKRSDVVNIFKDKVRTVDTTVTPKFLGLSGPDGVWQREYGGPRNAGAGIIIGDIDTGIWPENPMFAPLPSPAPGQAIIDRKWKGAQAPGGSCWTGTGNAAIHCNNKIIGARYYDAGRIDPIPQEYDSPRDYDGHGSHTASTAAGDYGVTAVIDGQPLGKASGMAPAARLAIYKALWESTDGVAHGTDIDLLAAINQAVQDGVDVINYSISGSLDSVVDPVELAFLNAAYAGVFVSAAAGNDGAPGTVAHNSPWLMTVAAGTHDAEYRRTITLGNGKMYTGANHGSPLPSTPIVNSSAVAAAGAKPADALLCAPNTLDPAKVTGRIVTCARGTYALVDKAAEVKRAGGVGTVIYNVQGGATTLISQYYTLPTIQVLTDAGKKIVAYAEKANATASLDAGHQITVRAPKMADFSSMGPAIAGGGDLLKPDITAPGVDIVAAVAPPNNDGQNFASYQGTSMATPHISGIAALIEGKHPNWDPAEIKSAMMTTATTIDNRGKPISLMTGGTATPLNYGSGHVVPARAFDPGLVYDAGLTDWAAYACAIGQAQTVQAFGSCDNWPKIDPSDLNYPSIAVGQLAGRQTVTRTVTNVSGRPGIYTARVQEPKGIEISVSPRELLLAPGAKATFHVTITRTTAVQNKWAFGSLTWHSLLGNLFGGDVRSPIAVKPVQLTVPDSVSGEGASGSTRLDLAPGYTGRLATDVEGLAPATVTGLALKDSGAQFDDTAPATSPRTRTVGFTVAPGGVGRVATFDADYPSGTDVDIYLYRKTSTGLVEVAYSAGGTAQESVVTGTPGTYVAYVSLFASPTAAQTVKANTWQVNSTAGNAHVSPAKLSVTSGEPAYTILSWSGLKPGTRYLGVVDFLRGRRTLGRTLVAVTG